ncbi:hypothetical protein [Streptomyces sp. NPDC001070]
MRPADRGAGTAIQVAHGGRRGDVRARDPQRVRGGDVQPGQPHADIALAALGDRLLEDVELCQHAVEPEPEQDEAPLQRLGRFLSARSRQPVEEIPHLPAQLLTSLDEVALDRGLCGGRRSGSGHHGLVQQERLHPVQPGQECAGLALEQRGRRQGEHGRRP